jgi:hypothetical protein
MISSSLESPEAATNQKITKMLRRVARKMPIGALNSQPSKEATSLDFGENMISLSNKESS